MLFREVCEAFVLSLSGVCRNEKGQTAIEYVLLIVLAVLVVILALQAAGIQDVIGPAFGKITDWIDSV